METEYRSPLREINNQPESSVAPKSGIMKLSEEHQRRFNKLVTKAKELVGQGMLKQALDCNKRALSIYHSEKLVKRINKMEAYLAQCESSSEDEGDEMAHVGNGFYLFRELYDKLYSHQREGILWLWTIHKAKKGGILGDDMGLGKTIQIISFLSGLMDAEQCHGVLIVLPVAVIINWEKEFEKWAPGIRVVAFHGASKRERDRALSKIHRRGGVVLTSYGMLINNAEQLCEKDGREFVWDYVILDEGHKIKNPSTKGSKAVHSLAARHRIILTGTPVQNNLKEMWSLFDWTHQGTLLGTARTFSMEYEQPIVRARQKDATSGEQRLGGEIASSLKKIITPYFLRRTKAEVSRKKKQTQDRQDTGSDTEANRAPEMPTFTRKNDLICWIFLSEIQQKIYEAFVQSEEVRDLLNTTRSPLTALVVLKKICDHPRLMTMRQCVSMGITMDDQNIDPDEMDDHTAADCAANRIRSTADHILLSESGKMSFLVELLDNLRAEGHRALVFSQSRKMLDIIQKVTTTRGHKVMRLDGTIRQLSEREEIIKKFSQNKSYSVFLLTTQVGGVGLTLTAADRVIIFDPSWNPATDAQAVDRAFRIGQDKNVVIYRLITCGSIEEKIYRRQIFKDSITKQTTGESNNPYRYFSRQELHELFVLDNPRHSTTQVHLESLHNNQRKTDTALDEHIAFLYSLDMFGVSDHDLMFSQEAHNDEDDAEEAGIDYVNSRVTKAQQAISQESESNFQLTQQLGKYLAPEVNQPRTKRFTGMEDVPQRPSAPQAVINLDDLHQKSMEEEHLTDTDDSDDVNESMSQLAVHDTPPQSQRDVSQILSPTPPPDLKQGIEHDASGSHLETRRRQLYDQVDVKPEMKLDPVYGSVNDEIASSSVKRRFSSEYVDLVMDDQDTKKGKLDYSGSGNSLINLDSDDCDVMDILSRDTSRTNPLGSEPLSIEESPQSNPVYIQTSSLSNTKVNPATPVHKKTPKNRRRSVCVTATPSHKFSEDELQQCINKINAPEANIIREELDFSPKPQINTSQSKRNKTPPSFNETEYETFAKSVPMNSTVLPGANKPPKFLIDDNAMDEEELDKEEDMEKSETDDEESDADVGCEPDDNEHMRENEDIEDETERGRRGVRDDSDNKEDFGEARTDSDDARDDLDVSEIQTVPTMHHRKAVIQSSDDEQQDEEEENDNSGHHEAEISLEQMEQEDLSHHDNNEIEDVQVASGIENQEQGQDLEQEDERDESGQEDEESEEESEDEISEEDQQKYIDLMTRSREFYKRNDYMSALQYALDALEVYSGDERAQLYAQKVQRKLQQSAR